MRLFIGAMAIGLAVAGSVVAAAEDAKATALLAQARAAIGGDSQIAKVKGLSAAGTLQRMMGDRTMEGEMTIDMELPDKLLRTDTMSPMGSMTMVMGQGINGDKLLRTSSMQGAPPGAMIRTPPPPEPGSDAEAQQLRGSRADLTRLALAMLFASTADAPLEFSYAGEAESPDGKADVLDVKGPSSFAAKLFLDKTSHRLLMLAYRGVAPVMVVQTQRGGGPGPGGPGATPQMPAPQVADIQMFFDDYKTVDGVSLPHHISRSIDGKPNEDWTFKAIKVNPTFKPETFSGK